MVYALVPLLSCLAYSALMYITLQHKPRKVVHTTFILYLAGVALWAALGFLLSVNFFPEKVILLSGLMLISACYTVVTYYHFLRASINKPGGIGVILGYGVLIALIPFIIQGRIAYVINNPLTLGTTPHIEYTLLGISLLALAAAGLVGSVVFELIQRYRHSIDPTERNKFAYLLAGFTLMALFGLTKLLPVTTRYPLAHFGNLGNALFITFAIVRYQLLDIRIVMRRSLVYAITGLCFIGLYFALLFGLLYSLKLEANYTTMATSAGVALLIAVLLYPIRDKIQRWSERLFYRDTYNYRQMLLTFANKMSHVLNMQELAESMLTLTTKTLSAKEASLYLPDNESGDFIPRFSMPSQGSRVSRLKLVKDNPILTWLDKEGRPFNREQVDILPQFKSLWEEERKELAESEIELFFPIKSKDTLIGVLALGKRFDGTSYWSEDLDLVMTMVTQAGVVMENAQLYATAKMRANTDELTQLFNHRYFHERLEEEITRGLRLGAIFSLILLDLDLFKRYNDIHGHLAGDRVLKQVGECLQSSLRSIDMGFRYGGDEFAVILPGTSSDDAYKVAERIRKKIEQTLDSQALLLTCSLGVASWPTDAVVREGLIHCADSALYQAKRWGNRTYLFSDISQTNAANHKAETTAGKEVLSTIRALAATVDARDHYTYGHSKRVADYAVALAEAIGYSPEKISILRTAALLHDIGKIGISDELLNKAKFLNEEDWQPVHAHPSLAVSILTHIEGLAPCIPGIQYHHERYDGRGYPSGLAGDNIPLDARIIAIADAYEAMTSPRPYRDKTLTHDEAIEELKNNAGTQFDAELVKVFCGLKQHALPRKVRAA
ncbi:MAG: diguanylate cyclase [Dehalococcoidales bacterium]|nr:diguanylate cyclase [Dehalococcoidales bacterium]